MGRRKWPHFNSGFIDNVETLMGLFDNQDHVKTLGENLQEEMGECLLSALYFGSELIVPDVYLSIRRD